MGSHHLLVVVTHLLVVEAEKMRFSFTFPSDAADHITWLPETVSTDIMDVIGNPRQYLVFRVHALDCAPGKSSRKERQLFEGDQGGRMQCTRQFHVSGRPELLEYPQQVVRASVSSWRQTLPKT